MSYPLRFLLAFLLVHYSLSAKSCIEVIAEQVQQLPFEHGMLKTIQSDALKIKTNIQSALATLTFLTKDQCNENNNEIIDITDKCFQNLKNSLKILWKLGKSTNPIFLNLNIGLFESIYRKGIKKECKLFENVQFISLDLHTQQACLKSIILLSHSMGPQTSSNSQQVSEFKQGILKSIEIMESCGQKNIAQKIKQFLEKTCYESIEQLITKMNNVEISKKNVEALQENIIEWMDLRAQAIKECK